MEHNHYNNLPKEEKTILEGLLCRKETISTFLKWPYRIFSIMTFCFAQVMYDIIADENVSSDKQPQRILGKDEEPRSWIVPQTN